MRTGPHLCRLAGAVAGLLLLLLALAAPAQAHAMLEESDPGPDSVLTTAPTAVTLRFSEDVNLVPGSLRVFAPDGTEVETGEAGHPNGDGTRVQVTLASGSTRPTGTYVVAWRVVSADSHPVSGAFDFAVGQPSAVGTEPAAPSSSGPVGGLLGGTRWVGYLGVAGLLGGTLFLIRCWPSGERRRPARRLLAVSGGVVVAGALAQLLLKGPYDAGAGLGRLLDPALVGEVLGTTYGRMLLLRVLLVAAVLLVLGTVWPARRALLAALGVALATTFTLTGHAVSGSPRWLAILSDVGHVLAMSVWLGGLAGLLLLLVRGSEPPATLAGAAARFSPLALGSVLVLAATGTYQAWRQVGGWAALGATTYGREVLVKLALVAAVLAAAALSRRWTRAWAGRGPLVVRAATHLETPPTETAPPSLRTLRRSVAAETLGVLLVLAVTAALVATEPAVSAYRPTVVTTLRTGPDAVRVTTVPDGDRRARIDLLVTDGAGRAADPAEVSAELALPSREIADLPVALVPVATGRWRATVAVPVAGTWSLTVTVRTTEVDQYAATTPVRLD